jgi:hypothetical protein
MKVFLLLFLLERVFSYGIIKPQIARYAPIVPEVSNAKERGSYWFYMQIENRLNHRDIMKIVYPSEFEDIEMGTGQICYINEVAQECEQERENVVKISISYSIPDASKLIVQVPNIYNPSRATGTSYFQIITVRNGDLQILDRNQAFGVIGIYGEMGSMTGRIDIGEDCRSNVGLRCEYYFKFKVNTPTPKESLIIIEIPEPFKIEEEVRCDMLPYDENVEAVKGEFVCTRKGNRVIIEGLNEDLERNTGVNIKLYSITNSPYEIDAGSVNFVLKTKLPNSSIHLDKVSIPNPSINPSTISSINLSSFNSYSKFSHNNSILTKLSFITSSTIPEGGSITINYHLPIQSDPDLKIGCWVMAGLPRMSDGTRPSCTYSNNSKSISLTNFGEVSSGAQIQVINQLSLSSSISPLSITSYTSTGDIIDQSSLSQTLPTLLSYSSLSTLLISYSNPLASKYSDITITIKPTSTLRVGSKIKVHVPSDFSLSSRDSALCKMQAEGKEMVDLSECRLSGNELSMITEEDDITDSDGAAIVIMGTRDGWKMPSIPTSVVNPIEWCVDLYQSGESSVMNSGCVASLVEPADFETGSGKSEVVSVSKSPNAWTPVTISLKIDSVLTYESDRSPQIDISFLTSDGINSGFPTDLGTGYSQPSSIPCIPLQSITNKSLSHPLLCTLTPSSLSAPTISITNFNDILSNSLLKIQFFLQYPSTPSLSSNLIKVKTSYSSHNNIQTILQEGYLPLSTSSSPPSFSTASLISRSSSLLLSTATISFQLKLTSYSSNAGDKIVIVFPKGWRLGSEVSINIGNIEMRGIEMYSNMYAPAIVAELDSKVLSGEVKEVRVSGIGNPSVAGEGMGKIVVGVLNTRVGEYVHYGEIDRELEATIPGNIEMNVSGNILSIGAGDVTYMISLKAEHNVPQGGEVHVIFPSGYDLQYSSCSSNSSILNISSQLPKSCTISGQTVKFSNFQSIPSSQLISLTISTVKNPSSSPSGFFSCYTLSSSNTSDKLDSLSSGPSLTLSSSSPIGYSKVSSFRFYPDSAGTLSELTLIFTLDCSVPLGGELYIVIPSSIDLPEIDSKSCIFNMHYASCSSVGNEIRIVPYSYFVAGITMKLTVRNVVVPNIKTDPVQISVKWNGVKLCRNPDALTGEFYYIPKSKPIYSIHLKEISAYPLNAAETSNLELKLSANSDISKEAKLLITFPEDFPEILSYSLICESDYSFADNERLVCENIDNKRYLEISGFKFIPSSSIFTIKIYNILNPALSGSTDNLSIQVLKSDNSVQNVMGSYGMLTFSSVTNQISISGIECSSKSIRSTASYSFYISLTSPISFPNNEIWISFPDYDYKWELYGYNKDYACSIQILSSNTIIPTKCINSYFNTIMLTSSTSSLPTQSPIKITIQNIKSSNNPGLTHAFKISTYNTKTFSFDQSTFLHSSPSDSLEFLQDRQNIIIESSLNYFDLSAGIIATYRIHTGSNKLPSRKDLNFSPSLLSKYNSNSIEISPERIELSIGSFSVEFSIAVSSESLEGEYVLEWNMTGDDSLLYHEPPVCLLNVSKKQFAVNIESIPTLLKGKSSIPIFIFLEAAPYEELIINISTPEGITSSIPTLTSGMTHTSFTLSLSDSLSSQIAKISYSLSGSNSESFYLSFSESYFLISEYDETDPELASLVINYPKNRLYADFTLQTTESCTLYYTYGQRGLKKPSNSTIVENAESGIEGYYINYVGGSLLYGFRIGELQAESDYVLYGYLKDMNDRYSDGVFTIDFFTEDMYEPARFEMKFEILPADDVLRSDVVGVITRHFAISEDRTDRVQLIETNLNTNTASYLILNDELSDLPSPLDMIQYMAIPSEFSSSLSPLGISLDTSFNIAASAYLVPNSHPEWSLLPEDLNLTSDSVQFYISLNMDGVIYAEVIADTDYLPSSRQVSMLLDAYNNPVSISFSQQVSTNESISILLDNLNPASSYILLITSKNSHSPPRLMKDNNMIKKNIITKSGTVDISEEVEYSILLRVGILLVILIV